ncbi:MAG: hypothetical protein K6T30_00010 [Alicyclobacillus sp.]|nr:hypothetical protein [Alicyclobacillus sp.]
MARVEQTGGNGLRIHVTVQDAVEMVREASSDISRYAHDIVTIYEKMPMFDFVHFCFYAYDSAQLFERQLGMNPREYQSFSLDAPDGFFYTLYGGAAALYEQAKRSLAGDAAATQPIQA